MTVEYVWNRREMRAHFQLRLRDPDYRKELFACYLKLGLMIGFLAILAMGVAGISVGLGAVVLIAIAVAIGNRFVLIRGMHQWKQNHGLGNYRLTSADTGLYVEREWGGWHVHWDKVGAPEVDICGYMHLPIWGGCLYLPPEAFATLPERDAFVAEICRRVGDTPSAPTPWWRSHRMSPL